MTYIGDNSYIENCIIEARGTIKAGTSIVGDAAQPKIVVEKAERYDA